MQIAYSNNVSSPALIGILKPRISLFFQKATNIDLRHELIHLKRKDLWIKMFVLVVSSLHWFDTLVYILRRDIHLWSELFCDEKVVVKMSYFKRKR